jgi:hypothetical protein
MSKTRRLLALAFATALIGGGGVALAAANGNGSESNAPAKAHISKQFHQRPAQHHQARSQQSHECPNSGSNSTANVAFDL